MHFHSFDFIFFFALVLSVYWCLPHRWQNLMLLAANYVFYGWIEPRYLALMLTVTVVDFTAANLIERRPDRKRLWLTIALVIDFGMLAIFKYLGFFVGNVSAALASVGWIQDPVILKILLPIGISFYVFQGSAYVIDVFRGQVKASRDFLEYAVFVSFFPQLVAGPIERSGHLLGQVQRPRIFVPENLRSGFILMLWGFFKKLVIADNTSVICNKILAMETTEWPLLWAGILAFGVQIYADFSAYSDIARGTARMLGFELIVNFNHPYLSRSPSEFWRRWHISLSTWFRDYVYIPLGGNRQSRWMTYRNLFITFLLSGLWHGASWNYVLWGAFHGCLLVGERMLRDVGIWREPAPGKRSRWWVNGLQWFAMFVLAHIGWLMFREKNFHYLRYYFTLNPFHVPAVVWKMGASFALAVAFYSLPLWLHPLAEKLSAKWRLREHLGRAPLWGQLAWESAAGVMLFAGLLLLGSETTSDFIYFQF